MDKYDQDKDGHINLKEFVYYLSEHERALRLSFDSLDHNKDGRWWLAYTKVFLLICVIILV